MSFQAKGIIPPIVTPIDDNGNINYKVLEELSVHLIESGVHGLFPMGTTGEFYAVDEEEYRKVLETVKKQQLEEYLFMEVLIAYLQGVL